MEATYIYFGTPLGPVAEEAEPKRRRFHGAFTGGFSAGYFNTVGSAKGWTPRSFTSSRSDVSRPHGTKEVPGNTVEDYLDDDELEELRERRLRTGIQAKATYDTFGDASVATARRELERGDGSTRMLIIPRELILPVPEGIGLKLLQASGFRYRDTSTGETPLAKPVVVHNLHNKDGHGLGYDSFVGAEEFRRAKSERRSELDFGVDIDNLRAKKRDRGIAFGVGVQEEDDSYGILDDYVVDVEDDKEAEYHQEVEEDKTDDEEDEPNVGMRSIAQGISQVASPPSLLPGLHPARQGLIPGFVGSSHASLYRLPYFPPPTLPPDYVPVVDLPALTGRMGGLVQSPTNIAPPSDEALKREIDRFAFFVARHGLANFESVAKQLGSAPFLCGGEGSDYYAWKVSRLAKMLQNKSTKACRTRTDDNDAALTRTYKKESKGQRASMVGAISEADLQALKNAMNSTFVRAEAGSAEENEEKREPQKEEERRKIVTVHDLSRLPDIGGIGDGKESLPVRHTEEWKPAPLLCKRLDVPEPSTTSQVNEKTNSNGVSKPSSRAVWRVDTLELPATAEALTKAVTALGAPGTESFLVPPSIRVGAKEAAAVAHRKETSMNDADRFLAGIFDVPNSPNAGGELDEDGREEIERLSDSTALEKPLDLFKAIFEEEEEKSSGNGVEEVDTNTNAEQVVQEEDQPPRDTNVEGIAGFAKLRNQVDAGSTDVERRIQEALWVVEEAKKSKRRRKDRRRGRHKEHGHNRDHDHDHGGVEDKNEEEQMKSGENERHHSNHRHHRHHRRRHHKRRDVGVLEEEEYSDRRRRRRNRKHN